MNGKATYMEITRNSMQGKQLTAAVNVQDKHSKVTGQIEPMHRTDTAN